MKASIVKTPVFIAGAGPAGAAAALKLDRLGISCVLADKSVFPRDKICGDAISGKVIVNLKRIDPEILESFHKQTWKTPVWGIRFVAPNGKVVEVPFSAKSDPSKDIAPGFVAKRIDFDNFLVDQVRKCKNVTFLEGVEIDQVEKIENGFSIRDKSGNHHFETPMYLDACGAHSAFARHYAGLTKRDDHHAGSLRAYYSNVAGFHEHNYIELQFLNPLIPGYFWVFPLPGGFANVGVGMRTDYIKKKKINLNKAMDQLIREHPVLKDRFKDSKLEGKIQGFGLPLGSKPRPISGENYMILGDAGHLIDPLTGEGIGHAIYSGVYAAEQTQVCIEQQNFSAAFIRDYDVRIKRVLGKEMELSYKLQRMMARPWLVNFLAGLIISNRRIIDIISRMYTDFELRTKIVRPGFWLKLILRKDV